MLEDNDIERLVERFSGTFATKDDINQLEDKLVTRFSKVFATKQDIGEITERLDRLEVAVAGLVTAVDGLVARVEMLNQEYLVLKERDSRYERWFKEIADKVGVTLTP